MNHYEIMNETLWRHQVETFSALLALCVGNSPFAGEFSVQMPVTRNFDASFAWANGWMNNRDAGDLKRYRAHYDVTVMELFSKVLSLQTTHNSPTRVKNCESFVRSKLIDWGRDKMAAIFQTTFSNGFSWIKMYEFRLKFHWILFLRV